MSVLAFILFEFLANFLVNSYKWSQQIENLSLAYTLHYYKLYIELFLLLPIVFFGYRTLKSGKKLLTVVLIVIASLSFYFFGKRSTAEYKFRPPHQLIFEPVASNIVNDDMIVLGIEINGQTKAYPESYITYHHLFEDSLGGKRILVTFCGLCRTGRVFEPLVNNEYLTFRLVGIHHNNAMFEDRITKSWWSQETGKCLIGKMRGLQLPELLCNSMTLKKWKSLHPATLVMQPDPEFVRNYRNENFYTSNIENPSEVSAEGTWSMHTFVISVSINGAYKAYEWSCLRNERLITDSLNGVKYSIALSIDGKSFTVLKNPSSSVATLSDDILYFDSVPYSFSGMRLDAQGPRLKRIRAYREYWFSWKTAHPDTKQYSPKINNEIN